MKIWSWNVNQFLGEKNWRKLKPDEQNRERAKQFPQLSKCIHEHLEKNVNDLFIIHEMPEKYIRKMANDIQECRLKLIAAPKEGIFRTVAIMLEKSNWKESDILVPAQTLGTNYANRYIGLRYGETDLKVLGVHIPMFDHGNGDCSPYLWDSLIYTATINTYRRSLLLLIGDFNVFMKGTVQKKKYYELQAAGAYDVWIETGHCHTEPTNIYGARVDYAFATTEGFRIIKSMDYAFATAEGFRIIKSGNAGDFDFKMDNEQNIVRFSDHEAIVLTIDESKFLSDESKQSS